MLWKSNSKNFLLNGLQMCIKLPLIFLVVIYFVYICFGLFLNKKFKFPDMMCRLNIRTNSVYFTLRCKFEKQWFCVFCTCFCKAGRKKGFINKLNQYEKYLSKSTSSKLQSSKYTSSSSSILWKLYSLNFQIFGFMPFT